jgi:hypothetical protein
VVDKLQVRLDEDEWVGLGRRYLDLWLPDYLYPRANFLALVGGSCPFQDALGCRPLTVLNIDERARGLTPQAPGHTILPQ